MEIIPLIHFKKRKIQITQNGKETKTEDFIKEHTNIQKIYILDHDGIEKDKPNLCSFPKLSEKYETWIDTRPVTLGDVVDTVMAGANTITIRQNLWQTLDIERIREITENQIYAELDITTLKEENETLVFKKADGFVLFNTVEQIEEDYRYGSILREISSNYKTYVYDPDKKNMSFWEKRKVHGLLVELEHI